MFHSGCTWCGEWSSALVSQFPRKRQLPPRPGTKRFDRRHHAQIGNRRNGCRTAPLVYLRSVVGPNRIDIEFVLNSWGFDWLLMAPLPLQGDVDRLRSYAERRAVVADEMHHRDDIALQIEPRGPGDGPDAVLRCSRRRNSKIHDRMSLMRHKGAQLVVVRPETAMVDLPAPARLGASSVIGAALLLDRSPAEFLDITTRTLFGHLGRAFRYFVSYRLANAALA